MTAKKVSKKDSKATATKPAKAKAAATAAKKPAAAHGTGLACGLSRIGWPNERAINLVCIDLGMRDYLQIPEHFIVRVNKVGRQDAPEIAMVVKQFRAFVGSSKASVSTTLATKLGLDADSKITIDKGGILESEAAEFRQQIARDSMQNMRAAVRASIERQAAPSNTPAPNTTNNDDDQECA